MKSEWEIGKEEYLKRLECPDMVCLEALIGLPKMEKIEKIVPLRTLKSIDSLIPMNEKVLLYLLKRIKTLDGQKPYAESNFSLVKHNPNLFKIGQKFVYRENYVGLLEGLTNNFRKFAVVNGLGDLGAYFAFGYDENNQYSLACYLPPIIEKHGENFVIMDGIHRDYIAKQAGMTMHIILVENVSVSFPCSFRGWDEIKIISLVDKPSDINERYFDLKKELFRDLKYLGIDG